MSEGQQLALIMIITYIRVMKYQTIYVKPLAEPLYSEQAGLICDSFVGGDPEDLVDGGTEDW